MVNPIYLIAIPLGVAFLLPLIDKQNKRLADTLFWIVLAASTFVAGQWLYGFVFENIETLQIFTAGVKPPLSINLQMGLQESLLLTFINLLGLIGGLYLIRVIKVSGIRAYVLYLVFIMGMNGLVMTRDLFNVFVFLEIIAIASYALIGLELKATALRSGFRYMIAGSIASIFFLLGIILLYGLSGTLNIDGMIQYFTNVSPSVIPQIAVLFLLLGLLIEMKQFPANGWALDVYQSANPGVSALLSAGSSGAILFALIKILPLAGPSWATIIAVTGLVTFLASNLMGLKQQNTTRLLGYSSVGQIGLILSVVGLGFYLDTGFHSFGMIILSLFFNHFFAKAGLYWLAGIVQKDKIDAWSAIQSRPGCQLLMGLFIFSLLGFPPFAGFWGKWSLVMFLAQKQMILWIVLLLVGSLLEAVYLLRWFGHAVGHSLIKESMEPIHPEKQAGLWIFATLSVIAGGISSVQFDIPIIQFLPFVFALVLVLLDWLPAKIKGLLVMAILVAAGVYLNPDLTQFNGFFTFFFLGGGLIMTIVTLHRKGKSPGFYPALLLMLLSLAGLTVSKTLLQFFLFWELMTLSSYLLILRGKKARSSAIQYILFSLGGAYFILTGFALIYANSGSLSLDSLAAITSGNLWIFITLAIGFLIKVAAIGFHIWAPGSYTEADDDVTPMLSGLLSKAGILGLLLPLSMTALPIIKSISISVLLGWAGALTAFFATLYAVFQEDIKKLLAWSSVGQVGYIVLGLAVMSHLGWVAAFWHTVNHFLFKGLIFIAIAGVIYRTGTRNMYEMGGLIKKMPLSFISVMMGIIALSGVPPLTGFGGKWLLYSALIERGWYLQTALSFFASTIAFLYCYRLIHTIFLGMPKPNFAEIKEAPVWFILPQFILIGIIMLLSVSPKVILVPISGMIESIFPSTLNWEGSTVFSTLGYWNATFLMIMVGAVFAMITVYLLFISPRPRKVKAFNIVYAAERPERPETTHYAYAFFSAYQRAMDPILKPLVKTFWSGIDEGFHTFAAGLRQIYSGSIQTYTLFILIYGLILYFCSVGVH